MEQCPVAIAEPDEPVRSTESEPEDRDMEETRDDEPVAQPQSGVITRYGRHSRPPKRFPET